MIYVSDKCIDNEAVSTRWVVGGTKCFLEVLTDAIFCFLTPDRLDKSCLCNDSSAPLKTGWGVW